ncbi:hypothetical protein psal_cds_597 [Pandoravirus salinus]|uniref:F-box incomplete domain containing protein n=1 Tax=Pandoravirus salinus TaxID=1349410 RepID=S4W2Q2_9VIRU|nr:hypothetical protein psal_cds_597 [Pandoravirus salinus]AGO84465.1 hypothetical protein psal_cds_597 [Pandoravirus salinus]
MHEPVGVDRAREHSAALPPELRAVILCHIDTLSDLGALATAWPSALVDPMYVEVARRCRPDAVHCIAAAGAPLHVVGPLAEMWSPVDMAALLADAVRGGRLDVVQWACASAPAHADTRRASGSHNLAHQSDPLPDDTAESSGEAWTESDNGSHSADDAYCDFSCDKDCPLYVARRAKAEHKRRKKERREQSVRAAWAWRRALKRAVDVDRCDLVTCLLHHGARLASRAAANRIVRAMLVRAARFGRCRALAVLHARAKCHCPGRLGVAALQDDHVHVLDWLNNSKCSGAIKPTTGSVEQALRNGSWRTLKWIGRQVARGSRRPRPASEEAMVAAASSDFASSLAAAQKYGLGKCTRRVVVAAVTSRAHQTTEWILRTASRKSWCGPWLGDAAAACADVSAVEQLLCLPEARTIFRPESASVALDRGRIAVAALVYRAHIAPLDRGRVWAACAALECRWHERDAHGPPDRVDDDAILDAMSEGYRSVLALSLDTNVTGRLFGSVCDDNGVPTWWGPLPPCNIYV